MPRPRALRSTVEMPARFSTATAIASTPRVIQFSTSSFWRGGVEAGRAVPNQLDAELLGRLLRAGAAADEIRIALGLRHHRDDRSAAAGAMRRAVPAAIEGLAIGWSDRTSQTFVLATISAPATIVAQRTAT